MLDRLAERIQAQMEEVSRQYDRQEDEKRGLVGQYTAFKMVLNTIIELQNEQETTEDSKPGPQEGREEAAAAAEQPAGPAK